MATVEIKMITMLIKLFSTKIVAKRCLGARSASGTLSRSRTRAAADLGWACLFSSKSLRSDGDREKNATSEPDTNALNNSKTAIATHGMT